MADKKKTLETSAELRKLSSEELTEKLGELRKDLQTARFQHAVAQLAKVSELKTMRRQVARISTILNEEKAQRS